MKKVNKKKPLIIILCTKYLSMAHKQKNYNNIVCNVSLYGSQTKEFGIETNEAILHICLLLN